MHVYGWLSDILEGKVDHSFGNTSLTAYAYLSEIAKVCQESRAPKFRGKVAA